MDPLQKYLNAFRKLKIDRAHGIAPHKPVLLLSVLQLVRTGLINSIHVHITPELVSLFKSNWSLLVKSKHDCRFTLPFYHLQGDKFWKLIPKPGFENIINISSSMRSFATLNSAIEYAEMNSDLFELMLQQSTNEILQRFLIDEYFSESHFSFARLLEGHWDLTKNIEAKILNEDPEEYRKEIMILQQKHDDEEIYIRGSIFKREIPKLYNNTCCISGLRIDATTSLSMVDACHIVPFSVSHDDTVTNGISLCPNLHRAFDRGLITINQDYRIIVANTFIENESRYTIRTFENQKIHLPSNTRHYPSRQNLRWHCENVFIHN